MIKTLTCILSCQFLDYEFLLLRRSLNNKGLQSLAVHFDVPDVAFVCDRSNRASFRNFVAQQQQSNKLSDAQTIIKTRPTAAKRRRTLTQLSKAGLVLVENFGSSIKARIVATIFENGRNSFGDSL